MKKYWISLILGGAILLVGWPALAGIDNTHHSMADYLTGTGKEFTCYACHGFSDVVPANAALGDVGTFCFNRCHTGATGLAGAGAAIDPGLVGTITYADNSVSTQAAAASGQEALELGHGLAWASFPTKDTVDTTGTSGWPYMTGSAQCTSCHDVHNNTNAPFLRAPLSMAANDQGETPAASITDTFCIRCHGGGTSGAGRYNLITNAPNGVHVVELDNTGGIGRTGDGRHDRRIVLKGGVFLTDTNWGTALNSPTTHWNLGGKAGGNPETNIGCYTCHQVHMNSTLTAPTGQTFKNLTVMAYTDNNLTTSQGDDLCVGCHGNTNQIANPGNTNFYHPAGTETVNVSIADPANAVYTVSTGTFNIVVNMENKVYGTSGRLVCTSCHAPAHADAPVAGSLVLNSNTPTCGSCHDVATKQTGTAPDSHHVYGGQTDYSTDYADPSYAAFFPDVGLANGLSCEDCHVFNQTAHNWD